MATLRINEVSTRLNALRESDTGSPDDVSLDLYMSLTGGDAAEQGAAIHQKLRALLSKDLCSKDINTALDTLGDTLGVLETPGATT